MATKKNPFANPSERGDIVEAAAAALEAEASAEAAPKEEKGSEDNEGSEETVEDPFAESEDVEEASDDGGEADGEEGDSKPDKKKSKGVTVPLSRLNKAIGQREEEKTAHAATKDELAATKEKLEAVSAYEALVDSRYQGNLALAKFDHDVMSAAERLAKADPEGNVAAVMVELVASAKSPHTPPPAKTVAAEHSTETTEAKVPKAVEKIIKRDAVKVIDAVLKAGNIDGAFAAVISKHIVGSTPLDSLTDIDQDAVVLATQAYLAENGLTLKQVRGAAKVPNTRRDKPPSGGRSGGTASTPTGDSSNADGEPAKQPADFAEYKRQRSQRLEKLVRELST